MIICCDHGSGGEARIWIRDLRKAGYPKQRLPGVSNRISAADLQQDIYRALQDISKVDRRDASPVRPWRTEPLEDTVTCQVGAARTECWRLGFSNMEPE